MTCFAYLRVSTDQQDGANQHCGLLEYTNAHLGNLADFLCFSFSYNPTDLIVA